MRRISWIIAGTILVSSIAATGVAKAATVDEQASTAKGTAAEKARKRHTTHKSTAHHTTKHHRSAPSVAIDNHGPLRLQSAAAVVYDDQSGKQIFSKNEDVPRPIASITKLMTAMVLLDAHLPMNEMITVTSDDVDTLRGSSSRLRVGTELTRGELLRLALMSSENRAAFALARTYPGSTPAFVQAMNQKAQALGMTRSHFVDPTGLHSENVATAEDLVKMVKAGYSYETIREFTTTVAYDVDMSGSGRSVEFRNTNALVKSKEWDIGVSKTGFIKEAGRCLVMQAKIAARPVIIVLLDSWGKYTRIGDANRIKRWVENTRSGRVATSSKSGLDV
jgi:D-alanyl-D-alanine endopeptidase (penicillin-binding protein 7)